LVYKLISYSNRDILYIYLLVVVLVYRFVFI